MKLSKLLTDFADLTGFSDMDVSMMSAHSQSVEASGLFCALAQSAESLKRHILDSVERSCCAVLVDADFIEDLSARFDCKKIDLARCIFSLEHASVVVVGIESLSEHIAQIASRFHGFPAQAMRHIGITGTNGKTSCCHFLTQALGYCGEQCAMVGTLGNGFLGHLSASPFTTDEPVRLHSELKRLLDAGAQFISMEVSSHGLWQNRVAGIPFEIALFTNISRDHLDYHGSMDKYKTAKGKLFHEFPLKAAVINGDDAFGQSLLRQLSDKDYPRYAYTTSESPMTDADCQWTLCEQIEALDDGFNIQIKSPWGVGSVHLPLLGSFNISNALGVYNALCLLGMTHQQAAGAIGHLEPVPGRLENLSWPQSEHDVRPNIQVVIDYAHTPDALEKVLLELKAHVRGELWCVFGCGGDRDKGKRPLMGAIAERLCEHVIITDDNPRTEDPSAIIDDVLQGIEKSENAVVLPCRKTAIGHALSHAKAHDTVLIAGKGHENYQLYGEKRLPFNDADVALKLMSETMECL